MNIQNKLAVDAGDISALEAAATLGWYENINSMLAEPTRRTVKDTLSKFEQLLPA
jgi:hypothetical protein